MNINESEIGKTIRALRKSKKLTLDTLAEKSGFTKGYLSKVENSDKAPPVSTLLNIASILGVGISELFREEQESTVLTLVRKKERQVIAGDGSRFGYSYEPLAHKYPDKQMNPYILAIPKDIEKTPFFNHPGEELFMVMEGSVRFLHGDSEYILEEGDSIYFDSGIAHRGFAENCDLAKCLIVIFRLEVEE